MVAVGGRGGLPEGIPAPLEELTSASGTEKSGLSGSLLLRNAHSTSLPSGSKGSQGMA